MTVPESNDQADRPLILVVEDNLELCDLLCEALGTDYSIAAVHTGLDGMATARRLRPDLILCDFMLPGLNGEQMLQAVRADAAISDTPVIMVTADPDVATHTRLLEHGANDFIAKPFDLAGLRARIANCLEAHFSTQGLRERESRMRHEVEVERQLSIRLQEALLPDRLVEHDSIEIAARYVPADELVLGGDWYDTFIWPDGQVGLIVGDVVGHGVEAAAAMARLRLSVGALASQTGGRLDELLGALERTVDGPNGTDYATACCAILDPSTGHLQYASAGHPPILLVQPSGQTRWLDDGLSPPFSQLIHAQRTHATTILEPGSTILMFSDGIVERRSEAISVGLARLARTARTLARASMDEICDRLIPAMVSDTDHRDDIVLVAMRFTGQGLDTSPPVAYLTDSEHVSLEVEAPNLNGATKSFEISGATRH